MRMHGSAAPKPVRWPVMRQRWETIAFVHWPVPVEDVQVHLPHGLRVEPWDGVAWVGLVPFRMHVHGPAGPALVPPFPETNVRTYVVGPGDEPGVWFFSLDAASRTAVTTARATWRLPYRHARMSVERDGDRVRYRGSRSHTRHGPVGYDVDLSVGEPLAGPGVLDHYLTARFTLWNVAAGVVMRTRADHPPWPLRQATVRSLQEDLLAAAGLTRPAAEPVVHFSEGVDVRIGAPRPVLG